MADEPEVPRVVISFAEWPAFKKACIEARVEANGDNYRRWKNGELHANSGVETPVAPVPEP